MNPISSSDPLPLREIRFPEAIGYWPLAPGWWYLIAASIAILSLVLYLLHRHSKPTALKEALTQLDRIIDDPLLSSEGKNQSISLLIKQLAVTTHGREGIAGLGGFEWVSWIESKRAGKGLSQPVRAFFLRGPYAPDSFNEAEAAILEIRDILNDIGQANHLPPTSRIKRALTKVLQNRLDHKRFPR